MTAPLKPKRPAPVERMLEVLLAVETGTRDLIKLVTEAIGASQEDGGLPQDPAPFTWWGHLPAPERDRESRARMIDERAADWEQASPAHARWSRLRDRVFFAVQDWRAALDTARKTIPTITPWTDRQDLPEGERWSAVVRGELVQLDGVINRITVGDVPRLEPGTIHGLETGLEQIEARRAELEAMRPDPLAASGPSMMAASKPDLEHFLSNLWACHELLVEVIRRRPLEEPPPTPAMLAKFHKNGSIVTYGGSPREEAVQRFYAEVQPAMEAWLTRAILEARDRAGGAAGEIVGLLQRGMGLVQTMAEAAVRVRSIWDPPWGRADAEHQEVTRRLSELLPLVAPAGGAGLRPSQTGRYDRLRPAPVCLVPSQPCPCRSWSPCPARLGPDG